MVFAAEEEEEDQVRALIDRALAGGACMGPDGRVNRWTATDHLACSPRAKALGERGWRLLSATPKTSLSPRQTVDRMRCAIESHDLMNRRQESFELVCAALECMKKAGWVKKFTAESPEAGYDITWTKEGVRVLESMWEMMEAMGGHTGRGCDQSALGALFYFAMVRFRDPSVGPQSGN